MKTIAEKLADGFAALFGSQDTSTSGFDPCDCGPLGRTALEVAEERERADMLDLDFTGGGNVGAE